VGHGGGSCSRPQDPPRWVVEPLVHQLCKVSLDLVPLFREVAETFSTGWSPITDDLSNAIGPVPRIVGYIAFDDDVRPRSGDSTRSKSMFVALRRRYAIAHRKRAVSHSSPRVPEMRPTLELVTCSSMPYRPAVQFWNHSGFRHLTGTWRTLRKPVRQRFKLIAMVSHRLHE
jgi:hypothetical protein